MNKKDKLKTILYILSNENVIINKIESIFR